MKVYQKINHFPGMQAIARKNNLAKNLMRLQKIYPQEFSFFPKTWLLPTEFSDFRNYLTRKQDKVFISKPEASCQGKGIFLSKKLEDFVSKDHIVVQRYIKKPYLIEDLKFDLRIYVLVAGCEPLRLFIHEEGLCRFATEQYQNPSQLNSQNLCMHLTNYAINKNSHNFIFNTSETEDNVGHKRSLSACMKILEQQGHDTKQLWENIKDIIIKTLCSVQPYLSHLYRSSQPDDITNAMCFEILGFDILLDHKLKPFLLEVNHSPSFGIDTPLDLAIKKKVISDTLRLMKITIEERTSLFNKKMKQQQQRVLTGKTFKAGKEEK